MIEPRRTARAPLGWLGVAGAVTAMLLATAAARASDPPAVPELEIEVGIGPKPTIYGGAAVEPCGWPTVVHLSLPITSCTGTLVHPEIVMTAAHCIGAPADAGIGVEAIVGFGEAEGGGERQLEATCFLNPEWDGQVGGGDFGYCRLAEPVEDLAIVPVAFGCELAALALGREATLVGFGTSDNGGSQTKRAATTTIRGLDEAIVRIGGEGVDSCTGDSGGPAFVRLAASFGGDDSWRAFGIVSGGSSECGQGGVYARMDRAVPFVESHAGIDLTPCHDAQGAWVPSEACGAHPLEPGSGEGSWAQGCGPGPLGEPAQLCAFDPPPDLPPDPPPADPASEAGCGCSDAGEPPPMSLAWLAGLASLIGLLRLRGSASVGPWRG